MAAERAQFEALAHEDPLTGLPNKRAFDDRLDAELRRAAREYYPVALVVLDPGEGHNLAGDEAFEPVRRELAERLERQMVESGDPLLDGPVAAPHGVRLNRQDQVSAEEPTYTVGAEAAVR